MWFVGVIVAVVFLIIARLRIDAYTNARDESRIMEFHRIRGLHAQQYNLNKKLQKELDSIIEGALRNKKLPDGYLAV